MRPIQSLQVIAMLRYNLKSFCKKSSVHGVVYIGHSRSHKIERIFWIFSLAISLIFTGLWISKLIEKLTKTPIVVAVADTQIHVSDIYFPSMTICPGFCSYVKYRGIRTTPVWDPWQDNSTYVLKYKDYNQFVSEIKAGTMDLTNFTDLDLEYLQVISLVTKDDFLSKFKISITTEKFIERLSDFLNFHDVYYFDKGNFANNYHLNYTQVISQNGFCFTFNFPSTKFFNELSKDFNYTKMIQSRLDSSRYEMINVQKDEYPLKSSFAELGIYTELDIGRYFHKNNEFRITTYFYTTNVENGYRITFHDPFEIISKDSSNYLAVFRRTSLFKISPSMMSYDDSFTGFSREQRNCYLPGEKSLKYFKVYNRINCDHECLANLTLAICKCSQFFMVRSESTRVCGVSDWNCFTEVDEMFSVNKSKCKCLSSCQRVDYGVEMKIVDYSSEIIESAKVEAKFADNEFNNFIYKRPYTAFEVIAFTGGLLGLFAGLSALSVIEVIYFLTLRILFSMSKVHPTEESSIRETTSKGFIKSFMEKSSVHGFYFIATEDSKIKKLLWILAFAISMYGCTFMAIRTIKKSISQKSVIVAQDSNFISVKEIPFPAISITGAFENSYDQIYDYDSDVKTYLNLRTMVEMHVCRHEPLYLLEELPFNYSKKSDFFDLLINITDNSQRLWFNERNATWHDDSTPKYFETVTVNGIGFTFNTLKASELLHTNKVSEDFIRIQGQGEINDPAKKLLRSKDNLKISFTDNFHLFDVFPDNDQCKEAAFFVHPSYEMPLNVPYKKFTKLMFGTSVEVLIKPEVIKSDENIRSMDIQDRQCYFFDEYQLKYFKHYSKSHCDLEVLSEFTFEKCGCVPFNFIRNKTMNICDISKWDCTVRLLGNSKIYQPCLPLCDVINYDFELVMNRLEMNYSENSLQEVILNFKFKESEAILFERHRRFLLVDVVCSIGGLFGLFAGVSLLTLLETFYLLILRPILKFLPKLLKKKEIRKKAWE